MRKIIYKKLGNDALVPVFVFVILPSHDFDEDLTKEFCVFFDTKIRNLRFAPDMAVPSNLSVSISDACRSTMNQLF